MRYIIIILFGLSLPATALVSSVSNDTLKQTVVTPKQSKKMPEELRKIIQKKTPYKLCVPEEELKMPTFY